MKNDVLNFVKFGISVQLDSPLYNGDVKLKRNSRNVRKNCSVVRKLLGDFEEAERIEKVNFKPVVVSPLNLVPKSNGSPRLIHNLKALNSFVKRGKLLGDFEEAEHIEKVNFKPVVVSPLNLVPKSNGSPRLIHNLKALNSFVKRGPSVKHLNVLELAKSEVSRKTYFCN